MAVRKLALMLQETRETAHVEQRCTVHFWLLCIVIEFMRIVQA